MVVPFPFTDRSSTKRRPALVLSDRNVFRVDRSILAMITTVNHAPWSLDTVIEELDSTGLNAPSKIRFKLFTLDNNLIVKKIGSLSKSDRNAVRESMKQVFPL